MRWRATGRGVLTDRRRARMVASAAGALAGLFSAVAGAFLAPWVVAGGAFGVRQVGRR
ncbi:MAG: hypothetical protein QOE24_2334 [Frankiales bacterium]|jgi:hypothetical protein|nr:hypothetical protein [Frankiales bacterium]